MSFINRNVDDKKEKTKTKNEKIGCNMHDDDDNHYDNVRIHGNKTTYRRTK